MWLCAVQILLGALEAEDAELLRHEDGLPLLLRLVHGPWRRGRRRHRRHAGQPPSRRAARRGRRREAPARPRRAREGRGGRRGGEEEGGERARGARRHGGGAGARVRCHPQAQQSLDAHGVAFVVSRIMWSGDDGGKGWIFVESGSEDEFDGLVWFESKSLYIYGIARRMRSTQGICGYLSLYSFYKENISV